MYHNNPFVNINTTIRLNNTSINNNGESKTENRDIKNTVIPLNIFQTWKTKDLPPKMKECIEKMKADNPDFNYFLYDDKDCEDFIGTYYGKEILDAYHNLIPLAYKADLWRYCVLYKYGGIYLDIKMQCEKGFKLMELTDKEYFILDIPYCQDIPLEEEFKLLSEDKYYNRSHPFDKSDTRLYNAVMACKPNNPVLLNCINDIVKNVKTNFYGEHQLDPTGPGLLSKHYFNGDYTKIKDLEYCNSLNGTYVLGKTRKVFCHYPNCRSEQSMYGNNNVGNYCYLWRIRKIYKNHM